MYSQKHGKEGVYKEFEESYIFHILYRYCFIYNTHNMQSAMVGGGGGVWGWTPDSGAMDFTILLERFINNKTLKLVFLKCIWE